MNAKILFTLAAAALFAGCATAPTAPAGPTGVDVARFHAIAVESVEISPTAADLSDADRAALEQKLRVALVESIPPSARASQAGEGVLQVKLLVTSIDAANPALNGVSAALIAVPLDRGSVAFDATFFDAPGGAAIGSTTVRHRSRVLLDLKGNFSRYGAAVGALREWGAVLADSLNRG